DLGENGDGRKNGAAVWRTYELEELLPFAETDTLKLTVGFENGMGKEKDYSKFIVDDFELTQSGQSFTGKQDPADRAQPFAAPASPDNLLSLGGRWYYAPSRGESIRTTHGHLAQTLTVGESNADRLYYKDDRLENPFAGNMGGWLRKGYLDRNGNLVEK